METVQSTGLPSFVKVDLIVALQRSDEIRLLISVNGLFLQGFIQQAGKVVKCFAVTRNQTVNVVKSLSEGDDGNPFLNGFDSDSGVYGDYQVASSRQDGGHRYCPDEKAVFVVDLDG